MYVIEVIPLTTLPPQVPQIFSYFFDSALARGALVEVPIQNKNVRAVVISALSVDQQKISLKKSAFQLKKITRVISESAQVSPIQFQIALWLAKHYYAPLGLCVKTVLPSFFGKRGYDTSVHRPALENEPPSELAIAPPLFIEARAYETISALTAYIKNAVEHGGQVLLISPDSVSARHLTEMVSKMYPVSFLSSDTMPSEYFRIWNSVASGECKLVVGTRVGLFLPFRDLWMLAVEDPFHESYKSDMSPKYNAPDLALKVAGLYGARAFFIGPIPNLNISEAIRQKEFEHEIKRAPSQVIPTIVDIGYERKTANYSVFSRTLQDSILEALRAKKRILLFSARRAYSSVLMCKNCSTLVKCKNCSVPMRVHQTSERILICYHCTGYQRTPATCDNCHSGKLVPSGTVGSQKIQEEMELLLEQQKLRAQVFILDSDLIRDDAQERELLNEIEQSELPVVVATHMIFSHRYRHKYDLIAIINADALMSAADFRAEERYFALYQKLLDFRPEQIVIQTYSPENQILLLSAQEEYMKFYEQELATRKLLSYPPYSRLVKLTYRHSSETRAMSEARALNEKMRMAIARSKLSDTVQVIGPSPASIAREREEFVYNIILKIRSDFEPLDSILRFVPTHWQIDVDPKQLI